MTTLNTAFKKIYGEALAPYGFIKVKSKQPYFARMIGDDILHIITFKSEFTSERFHKAFTVLGGIATVYRRDITLDESPRNNTGWLNDNAAMYREMHKDDFDGDYWRSLLSFLYEDGNEESMLEALKQSLEVTKEYMLPVLDAVNDLRTCIEHYRAFRNSILYIYADENFGKRWGGMQHNEGLLHLMVYSVDEYANYRRKTIEQWYKRELNEIKTGESSLTFEDLEKMKADSEQQMIEQIANFTMLKTEPEHYARAMEELKNRKAANIERLSPANKCQ